MNNPDYLVTTRRAKGTVFEPEPGKIRFLRVPSDRAVPVLGDAAKGRDVDKWFSEVRGLADGDSNPFSISPRGDVLFFVHGYNNDLDIVMKRQRRLAADLAAEGWKGVVVGFDWPSDNKTLNYIEDRNDAAKVAGMLVTGCVKRLAAVQRMVAGQEIKCETNVHLLGHSTGAYVIMEAFAASEKIGDIFKSSWRVGQVAFIAGDVSSASLSEDDQWSAPMFRRIMRLTNYSNPFDKVLAVSNAKRLGVAPRAGRMGLPPGAHTKAVNVDCGRYFCGLDPDKSTFFGTFNHSWHIGDRVFARDLAMTIEGGIDRSGITTRGVMDGALILKDAPRPKHQEAWDKQ